MSVPTPSQTVGPFFGVGLGPVEAGGAVRVEGQVLDGAGEVVPDALIEVSRGETFGRCRTDEEGAFHFMVAEGPFLNLTVFARGLLRHLNTRVYFPGHEDDEVLALVDPARRQTLIARREDAVYRFDIRLQGEDETVFFA
jgi:protocatechuate 3,4-dioxygenase alpha subunit